MPRTVYAHWVEHAQVEAWDHGIRGRFVAADQLGEPDYAADVRQWCDWGGRYVLFLYPIEARMRNDYGEWEHARNAIRWLHQQGIAHLCQAIQIGDETWSWLYTGAQGPLRQYWPTPASLPDPWGWRWELAHLFDARAWDLRRRYWPEETGGMACPAIGTAETGGCEPPQFATQDWWGLNIYTRGRHERHRRAVQRIYALAWRFTHLPIMPVIPAYVGGDTPPLDQIPTVVDLGLTYAQAFEVDGRPYPAIIDHPQTWAVGLFCWRSPGVQDGDGRGLTRLDQSYRDGVRWLTAHLGR